MSADTHQDRIRHRPNRAARGPAYQPQAASRAARRRVIELVQLPSLMRIGVPERRVLVSEIERLPLPRERSWSTAMDQTEWLGPVDRELQRGRVRQELLLGKVVHF